MSNITGSELRGTGSAKTITLGGKTYEIALDMNAICDLEERYGSVDGAMKVLDGIDDLNKPGVMKNIRFLLCVMLRHSDENMTEREAGRLMRLDDMQHIMNALGDAMQASMPEGDGKNATSPQET